MLFPGVWYANGSGRQLSFLPAGVVPLYGLDSLLNFANVPQIFVESTAVTRAKLALKAGCIRCYPVQNAPVGTPHTLTGGPSGRSFATKQILKRDARVNRHW